MHDPSTFELTPSSSLPFLPLSSPQPPVRVPTSSTTEPLPGIDTTYDVVQYAATTYPNRRAFGTRPVLDIVKETKTIAKMVGGQETTQEKEWSFFKLGAYEWISEYCYTTFLPQSFTCKRLEARETNLNPVPPRFRVCRPSPHLLPHAAYKEFAEWTGWLATGLWELGLGRREGAEDQFVNIFGATK